MGLWGRQGRERSDGGWPGTGGGRRGSLGSATPEGSGEGRWRPLPCQAGPLRDLHPGGSLRVLEQVTSSSELCVRHVQSEAVGRAPPGPPGSILGSPALPGGLSSLCNRWHRGPAGGAPAEGWPPQPPSLHLPGQGVPTGRSSLPRPSPPARVTCLPALPFPTPLSGISWRGSSRNPGVGAGHFPSLCLFPHVQAGLCEERRVIGWERLPATVGVQDK